MHSKQYKFIELLILFISIPLSYLLEYSLIIKLAIGITAFLYVLYILLKVEKTKIAIRKNIQWNYFWKSTLVKLLVIGGFSSVFVWFTDKVSFFNVVVNKPKMWLFILFFYAFFSVYPQELLYRTFFFKRYKKLFNSNLLFILTNGFLFSLGHVFFKNIFVLCITFIGGILFAFTYKKTSSTLLVTIEHAIYGCWLFTVGMGNMLGFPS